MRARWSPEAWSGQRAVDSRRQRPVRRRQGGFDRDRCMGHADGYPRTGPGKRCAVTIGRCRQPEAEVDRGAGWAGVDFHPVAERPHQHKAPPTVAGVGGPCLPRTGVGDPRLDFAVGDFGFEPHCPGLSAVRMPDAVAARFVDDQHDVGGQRGRDLGGAQPRGQPMPDVDQLVCGGLAFDAKQRRAVPVYHHRDVVVVPGRRGQLVQPPRPGASSKGSFAVATKAFAARAIPSSIDSCLRSTRPSVNSISVEPGGSTREACGRGSSRRTASGTDAASVNTVVCPGSGPASTAGMWPALLYSRTPVSVSRIGQKDRRAVRVRNERRRRIELLEQQRGLGAGESTARAPSCAADP